MTRRATGLLGLLLAACVARLWLTQLASSFWLDEMATVFVARYGPQHWSLAAAAPQAWKSVYYYLPRAASAVLGESEIAFRLPSVLLMAVALLLIGRLAARLIHPQAAWFAVFACLTLKGINYEAADARPYALGIAVAAAALLFLVRWFDGGRWLDGLAFAIGAALLWRVHLLFWPIYLVFAAYAAMRLSRANWLRTLGLFVLAGAALIPVFRDAVALLGEAQAHAIGQTPGWREFAGSLKLPLALVCGAGACLLARGLRWAPPKIPSSRPALTLILGWWLAQPVALFLVSRFTAAGVFVPRYLAISLPGAALAATLAAASFIPADRWKPLAAALGLGALIWLGQWNQIRPLHHNSDWRQAARAVNQLALDETPVLCPSPFVEATAPAWRPDYPLPGFLYCHLDVYKIRGKPVLLPFRDLPPGMTPPAQRFLIYGWEPQVRFWRDWLSARPELAGWRMRRLGPFADVDAVLFETGSSPPVVERRSGIR